MQTMWNSKAEEKSAPPEDPFLRIRCLLWCRSAWETCIFCLVKKLVIAQCFSVWLCDREWSRNVSNSLCVAYHDVEVFSPVFLSTPFSRSWIGFPQPFGSSGCWAEVSTILFIISDQRWRWRGRAWLGCLAWGLWINLSLHGCICPVRLVQF